MKLFGPEIKGLMFQRAKNFPQMSEHLTNNSSCILDASIKLLTLNIRDKFKILQLADMHYDNDPDLIKNNQQITRNLISLEGPDLVVFSGDQVSGWKTKDYESLLKALVQPLIDTNTNWATILGNHDIESNLSPQDILCLDSQYTGSMTLHTNLQNRNNSLDYILPIHTRDYSQKVAHLILLDASIMECDGKPGSGCVSKPQLQWLEAQTLNTTSLAFLHQPMPEYNDLYHHYNTYGLRKETSGCSSENPGLFQTLKRLKSWGTSVGHDHNNEYTGEYDTLTLNYGRKTGFGSYGPDFTDRGARVFEIDLNGTVKTWIRTEKEVILEQVLNIPDNKFLKCGEEESWTLVIVLSVLLPLSLVFGLGFLLYFKRWRRKLTSA